MCALPFFSKNKGYTLSKSHHILSHAYGLYKKKGRSLAKEALQSFEQKLQELDQACLGKDRQKASELAQWVERFIANHFKKNFFDYFKEFAVALLLALAIATVVRQSWFEIYEIPTGSMRPTFKEQDDLTVSKTAFGINIPLKTKHFYFDPALVERGGVIIFSGDGIDLPDTDTTYFGLFPAKKRYTKRMIGKPGDHLYFYGGKIYGIDKNGHEIRELLEAKSMQQLEHIPFLSFEGKPASLSSTEIVLKHMNMPIGKILYLPQEGLVGEINTGENWKREKLASEKKNEPEEFGDFFGIGNFAMARIITRDQLPESVRKSKQATEGTFFLELAHSPSLTYPKPKFTERDLSFGILLDPEHSYIPLSEVHLQKILENLYTARFNVKNQFAKRYSVENGPFTPSNPKMTGIPDGTYEFYYGKAHQIGFWGISKELPQSSPLYNKDPRYIKLLFNQGIDFLNFYEPSADGNRLFPHRYAYFRDGNLYLMGSPILTKDDPVLKEFVKKEKEKQSLSPKDRPYRPFIDRGAPIKEGKFDRDFIEKFGLSIPEKHYFVLGDNHAMSADSRIFGFVPESNLQGAPSLLIWPPGERFGFPNQQPYPFLNTPRLIVWGIFLLLVAAYLLYRKRERSRPVFKKVGFKS
ncbi:signal peptidase I [Estrella lausannensis]|uniref:Signal peptidase I n=1 Tax=Estrella lausannensis TaxID=483423 RepID=A0A0H5DR59_9BACT|nr:signal peptidase I [Estrella lausannensis]CRX38643.1 Signal peptidase I [Estrella lausannensis]